MKSSKKSSLFSIFFTFAVDNLGATIVFPIFAPLFLTPSESLFNPNTSFSYKTSMLGVFLGIFPLMQFIFAPILGEYADHAGRKKALLLTTFLTFWGYGLSAWGIHSHSLITIFISRLIMGVGAANLSICLSTISDLSPNSKRKERYFSYGSSVAGLTFILGPFIGGKLSDSNLSPLFTYAFPLIIGAILGAFNVLFILFSFEETLKRESKEPFDFIKGIHNIQLVLKTKAIRSLYLIYFFYLFAWNIVFLFVPAFVVQNFHLSSSRIGDVCALLGVCWILGTGVLHRMLQRTLPLKTALLFSFLAFAFLVIFIPYQHLFTPFMLILGGCTIFSGLIWPLCTGAISNGAPPEIQGRVMGLSQSMLSITMMLSSLVGGVFLAAHSVIPFLFSAISILLAGLILLRTKVA